MPFHAATARLPDGSVAPSGACTAPRALHRSGQCGGTSWCHVAVLPEGRIKTVKGRLPARTIMRCLRWFAGNIPEYFRHVCHRGKLTAKAELDRRRFPVKQWLAKSSFTSSAAPGRLIITGTARATRSSITSRRSGRCGRSIEKVMPGPRSFHRRHQLASPEDQTVSSPHHESNTPRKAATAAESGLWESDHDAGQRCRQYDESEAWGLPPSIFIVGKPTRLVDAVRQNYRWIVGIASIFFGTSRCNRLSPGQARVE